MYNRSVTQFKFSFHEAHQQSTRTLFSEQGKLGSDLKQGQRRNGHQRRRFHEAVHVPDVWERNDLASSR